jgi:ribonuclease P protein component
MTRIARHITQWPKKDIGRSLKRAQFLCRDSAFDIRTNPTKNRIGKVLIVIPRRVGSAPERNKIRRRAKAIFFENQLFTLGYDWIIFFKPAAKYLSFAALQDYILRHCVPQLQKSANVSSSE